MIRCVNRSGRALWVGIAFLSCTLATACRNAGNANAATDARRVEDYLRTFLLDRKWSEWPDYFAETATINGSSLGLQIMRGTADGLNYSFAELTLRIVDQVAEPDHVATLFVLEGRHQRPFNDQPATNRRIELDGFVIDRFRDHKIVESRMILDVWGLSRRAAAAGAEHR
jgi:predicted ester cyclase